MTAAVNRAKGDQDPDEWLPAREVCRYVKEWVAVKHRWRLTVDAVLARDYPIIQGLILVFSGVYVVLNLLIDIAYTLLDPRIRY